MEAHDGEFLVLVGPSGCGKTTALRMVAGLEEISDGDDLDRRPRGQRPVAEGARHRHGVPELRPLPAPVAWARTSPSGCGSRKEPKSVINERVAWAAKLLDLTPYLDRKPKELSGGQRQRVAMGRAIVRTAAGLPDGRAAVEPRRQAARPDARRHRAASSSELGTTTIYVTHDQVEAMTMGDRVAVMSKGVLQQVDAPQRLYDRPANLFVAGFIGTPPMNLLEGAVSVNGGVVDRPRRRTPSRSPTRRSPTIPACATRTGTQGDRRPARRRPASGAGARRPAADPRRASSWSSRSAASRWRTSRWTRAA